MANTCKNIVKNIHCLLLYIILLTHSYNPMKYSSNLLYHSTQLQNTVVEQLQPPGRLFPSSLQYLRTAVVEKYQYIKGPSILQVPPHGREALNVLNVAMSDNQFTSVNSHSSSLPLLLRSDLSMNVLPQEGVPSS